MASIKSTIRLVDRLSSPAAQMASSVNEITEGFNTLESTMNSANFNSAFDTAEASANNVADSVDNVADNVDNAATKQQKFNQYLQNGVTNANSLLTTIKKVAAAYLTIQAAGEVLDLSDTLTSAEARLSLSIDDEQTLEELENMIYNSAQSARASYTDMLSDVATVMNNAGDAFSSSQQAVVFTELVEKEFVLSGSTSTMQSAGMTQLTQALSSGVLRGDEFTSVMENATDLAQTVADYMGVAKGDLIDMAAEGELTSDIIVAAVLSSADDINAEFESMAYTFAQLWTSFKNQATLAFDPVLERLSEIANSDGIQNAITYVAGAVAALAGALITVFGWVTSVYNVFADNWSWIRPIILGIVAALAIYTAALLINTTITAINTALKALQTAQEYKAAKAVLANAAAHGLNTTALTSEASAAALAAAGLTAEKVATAQATVAQAGFNTALLACPLTWILLIIIAVIAAIFIVIGIINQVTDQSISAIGVIAGGINWLVQLFKNAALWVVNVALGIWNAMKACVSNIKTAFSNAWINIKIGWLSFVNVILSGVLTIIEWLNKIPGVSIETGNIESSILTNAAEIAELQDSKGEYESIADAFSEGYNTYNAFEDGWSSDAYESGYEWGEALSNKISSALDFSSLVESVEDIAESSDYTSDTSADTAESTSDISDTLDATEEDLQYLRDLAEREAVNRFTTAEISVTFGDVNNNVSSETDLDGIVDYFSNGVTEAMAVAAEGVH